MQTENLQNLTFEQLPQAVAALINEVKEMKSLLQTKQQVAVEPADQWFNLEELCAYLPDRPAKQTVYGWIGQHIIPYHKKGKSIVFRKSEIDEWLRNGKRKSLGDLEKEAQAFVNSKRKARCV